LPISILEAQASGVPVFAAPTAGVPELVVDGKTGYLIDRKMLKVMQAEYMNCFGTEVCT
jgi:glycosyltransferase involved in cell wall biosynthesis